MSELSEMKCTACRGGEPTLTEAEIGELRPRVPGWQVVEREGIKRLERVFGFRNFAEADRHNIRGEKISVDTIPLVGEGELAAATRAVARLPRAVALVLAGALMGGEVARAVREIREKGIIVLSLNMPGTVPAAADLVVSDPVQCGVMAVMAVSDSASFDIARQRGRRY